MFLLSEIQTTKLCMSSIDLASPDKQTIRQLFDGIAGRYDLINSFLSLNLDEQWRKRSCALILEGNETSILDLGVGTGKFLQLFLSKRNWDRASGLDFSSAMLSEAKKEFNKNVACVSADFHDLPFSRASFDLVVSSFTLRSVKNMPQFLSEVFRILTPGGKTGFLCLTRPKSLLCKLLYYPYLNFYLPLMGRFISGNADAYQFLSRSIQSFQDPEDTKAAMRDCGFHSLQSYSFTFGAATLIIGKK